MNAVSDIPASVPAATLARASAMSLVEIKGLHKRFGETDVLRGIDVSIAQSEVVCLIGPSGSGKSTLLRCMAALETYDHGEIRIGGEMLGYVERNGVRVRASNAEINRVRRNIGMVFQQFNLWPHMSVLGNVTEALRRVRRLPVAEANAIGGRKLEMVGMSHKADAHPSKLSGGQQQRVAIARALAMEPNLMLFDEPTSALDPELVGEVLQVMKQLARDGMTMVVVTHEMGFAAQMADRVVFLDHGRIAVSGAPGEVFRRSTTPRLQQFLQNYRNRNAFWKSDDATADAEGPP